MVIFEYRQNARLRLWLSDHMQRREPLQVVFRRGAGIVQLLNLRRFSNQPINGDSESNEEIQVEYLSIEFNICNFSLHSKLSSRIWHLEEKTLQSPHPLL